MSAPRGTPRGTGLSLVQNCSKPGAEGVAINDEFFGEVRHVQYGPGSERLLKRQERVGGGRQPEEGLTLQQRREGSGEGTIVVDEATVVPGEAEKATERLDSTRLWPRWTASIFSGSMATPPSEMMCPK